jgi:hypothetical protein
MAGVVHVAKQNAHSNNSMIMKVLLLGKGMCVLGTLYSSMNVTHSFIFGHFSDRLGRHVGKDVLSGKEKPMDVATASDVALMLLVYENYWPSWEDRHENKMIVRPLIYMKQEGMCYGEWKYQEN